MTTIGVISDTHGLLRPQAVEALQGTELILHAGDIGSPEVIENLKDVAPVVAVRGNIDKDAWAKIFPPTALATIGKRRIYILHNIQEIDLDPAGLGYDIVVSGHSHKPSIENKNGVLYLNPGSAGRRRFKLPVTVAKIELSTKNVAAQIIELGV